MYVDQQTLRELQIFSTTTNEQGLFDSFSLTQSQGGKHYLKRMFESPLKTLGAIQERQDILTFLLKQSEAWMTEFSLRQERVMENYFFSGIETITHTFLPIAYLEGLQHTFFYGTFREIEAGCTETLQFIRNVYHLYERHQQVLKPYFLEDLWKRMDTFFEHKDIKHMMNTRYRLTFSNIYRADRFFREVYKKEIRELIQTIFKLDAFNTLAVSIRKFNLSFPEFINTKNEHPYLRVEQLRHPQVSEAVPNDLELKSGKHFLFLTGPNMAGKTTFLRAIALAIYMAHLGIGVAAKSLQLTLCPALLTSLQNEDSLELGYSYYYSEVNRVRQAAELIRDYPQSFVIMDELFRGTNYEDAYKGTQEIIERVLQIPHTLFILSSHIHSLGEQFSQRTEVQTLKFSAEQKNKKFHFSYQLKPGVSYDKIGLDILKQEGVLDLLSSIIEKENAKA